MCTLDSHLTFLLLSIPPLSYGITGAPRWGQYNAWG